MKKSNFVERIYLSQKQISAEEIKLHIARYNFAKNYLNPADNVLDATCGSGYGSEILSHKANKIIGIDISSEAIKYAGKSHKRKNITYKLADFNRPLQFPDKVFDAVVCFETIEHIKGQQILLSEFKRVLKSKGILIISTPNKDIVKKFPNNPYHVKELYPEEFINLIKKFFYLEKLYGQLEFIDLPLYKKLLKKIIKIDVLKIRKPILKCLKLTNVGKEKISSRGDQSIKRIDLDSHLKYFTLIAIAKNL